MGDTIDYWGATIDWDHTIYLSGLAGQSCADYWQWQWRGARYRIFGASESGWLSWYWPRHLL